MPSRGSTRHWQVPVGYEEMSSAFNASEWNVVGERTIRSMDAEGEDDGFGDISAEDRIRAIEAAAGHREEAGGLSSGEESAGGGHVSAASSATDSSDPEPVSVGSDFVLQNAVQKVFFEANANLAEKKIQFPWETGLMGMLFNTSSFQPAAPSFMRMPAAPHVEAKPTEAAGGLPGQQLVKSVAFCRAVKRARKLVFKTEHELRHRAMTRWKNIIDLGPGECTLGRQILSKASVLQSDETIMTCISDSLAPKSTETLFKRSSAIIRYAAWCRSRSYAVFPISEDCVYEYVVSLREGKAGATAANGFVQALNFAGELIGLDGAKDSASSKGSSEMPTASMLAKSR